MSEKKLYFAAAIRGDLTYVKYFSKIIDVISEYGEPLTERFKGYNPLELFLGEKDYHPKQEVFKRDIKWLGQSDAVISEISGASTGTGGEIIEAKHRRIPTLLLCHSSSQASMLFKQWRSKYLFPQEYSGTEDLEFYLRSFLETIRRTEDIELIGRVYSEISKEVANKTMDSKDLRQHVVELLEGVPRRPIFIEEDLGKFAQVYVLRPRRADIDFKDANVFARFLHKNLVLQHRWEELQSQRIGSTFASGRKFRIIAALARYEGRVNILQLYRLIGEDRIKYTKEAFTKNVRAYRKIGLLLMPEKRDTSHFGTTKFKDKLVVFRTIDGKIEIASTRSRRETVRSVIVITRHLQHLSSFLDKFGTEALVSLVKELREREWYPMVAESVEEHNIDFVQIGPIDDLHFVRSFTSDINNIYRRFAEKHFSSFHRSKKTRSQAPLTRWVSEG